MASQRHTARTHVLINFIFQPFLSLYVRPTPTLLLIVANAAVYLLIMIITAIWPYAPVASVLSLPADFASVIRHPWTIATYMFVHYDFWHLLINMLWLYTFGVALEITMAGSRVVRIYIAGGIAGAIMYLIASLTIGVHGLWLTGASASVLAITIAAAFRSPDYQMRLMLLGSIQLKWLALGAVVLIFIGGGGGLWAHIGGLLAGIWPWIRMKTHLPAVKIPDLAFWKRRKHIKATAKAMKQFNADNKRLDELIDKIRVSGHDSLSASERNELKLITRRLKNK